MTVTKYENILESIPKLYENIEKNLTNKDVVYLPLFLGYNKKEYIEKTPYSFLTYIPISAIAAMYGRNMDTSLFEKMISKLEKMLGVSLDKSLLKEDVVMQGYINVLSGIFNTYMQCRKEYLNSIIDNPNMIRHVEAVDTTLLLSYAFRDIKENNYKDIVKNSIESLYKITSRPLDIIGNQKIENKTSSNTENIPPYLGGIPQNQFENPLNDINGNNEDNTKNNKNIENIYTDLGIPIYKSSKV